MKKLITLAALLQMSSGLQSQINLTSDLIICMPIAGNANDLSGNGNNGFLVGSPTLIPDRFGNPNSAYLFNGATDYIKVAGSTSLDRIETNSELTISAWCYVKGWYQNWNVFAIFDRYNALNDYGWDYSVQAPVGCPEQFFNPNWPAFPVMCNYVGGGTTTFGSWVHYAITYSKANGMFYAYKNSLLVGSGTISGLNIENTNNGTAFIGYSPSGPDEFSDGAIDEVMVYNRALNPNEILALYNGYNGCGHPYDGQHLNAGGSKITGIKDIGAGSELVSLFPNPASNKLNIAVKSETQTNLTVTIRSYDGKIVMVKDMPGQEAATHTVDIADLPKGIYMVTISNGKESQNTKFVKE